MGEKGTGGMENLPPHTFLEKSAPLEGRAGQRRGRSVAGRGSGRDRSRTPRMLADCRPRGLYICSVEG